MELGGGREGRGKIVRGRTVTPSSQVLTSLGKEAWPKNCLRKGDTEPSHTFNTLKALAHVEGLSEKSFLPIVMDNKMWALIC